MRSNLRPLDVRTALRIVRLRLSAANACRRCGLAPSTLRRSLRATLGRGGWRALERFGYDQYDFPASTFGKPLFGDGFAIAGRAIDVLSELLGRPSRWNRYAPEAVWVLRRTQVIVRVRSHFDQDIPVLVIEERGWWDSVLRSTRRPGVYQMKGKRMVRVRDA